MKELYLDFNCINSIQLKHEHDLELLSVSHNQFSDNLISLLPSYFPELRCLNLSYNRLSDLRNFVNVMGQLSYLKILISFENPISILAIYYTYITDHLRLAYFDGAKYVKEEPKIEKKEEPKEKV